MLAYREEPSFFAVARALRLHHQTVQRCVERAVAEKARWLRWMKARNLRPIWQVVRRGQRTLFDAVESCVSCPLPLRWCPESDPMHAVYSTKLGKVYQADCLELLGRLRDASVHTVFADPPFNLKKHYGRNGVDDLPAAKYLEWSKKWMAESVRVLAPGGALFLYNLPKWLMDYGCYLNSLPEMTFKHSIRSLMRRTAFPSQIGFLPAITGYCTTSRATDRVCSIGIWYEHPYRNVGIAAATLRTTAGTRNI